MGLVITQKLGHIVKIGDVMIRVYGLSQNSCRLYIDAPNDMRISRLDENGNIPEKDRIKHLLKSINK